MTILHGYMVWHEQAMRTRYVYVYRVVIVKSMGTQLQYDEPVWISQDFKTTLGISKSTHYLMIGVKDSSGLCPFTQIV